MLSDSDRFGGMPQNQMLAETSLQHKVQSNVVIMGRLCDLIGHNTQLRDRSLGADNKDTCF